LDCLANTMAFSAFGGMVHHETTQYKIEAPAHRYKMGHLVLHHKDHLLVKPQNREGSKVNQMQQMIHQRPNDLNQKG